MLAGVSVEYYAKLERGHLAGVSDSVLEAVSRALGLDEAEHAHLLDLARTAGRRSKPGRRTRAGAEVRAGVRWMLETITDGAAFVRNGRLDLLAANDLGRALYAPVFANAANRGNLARFCYLDPASKAFYPDWENSASVTANLLRTEAGRDPHNPELTELVGELSTRSQEFRVLWAAHDVRLHHTGTKRFRHPAVGELTLAFEAMPLPADPGLTFTTCHAEPGTASHDVLRLLASWAASGDGSWDREPGPSSLTAAELPG
jgi:hypothetical protein